MRERFEYVLDLQAWMHPLDNAPPAGLFLRPPEISDQRALAALMLEAYRDTIDYEGETMTEAVAEVQRYLAPRANRPLLEPSVVLTDGTMLVSACLITHWSERNCALIGYVISHPAWQRRGLALRVVVESLRRLANEGHRQVRAIITKGNVPSEELLHRLGFAKVSAL
jgi:RimJ/RimL family protein N-acetyltransferase